MQTFSSLEEGLGEDGDGDLLEFLGSRSTETAAAADEGAALLQRKQTLMALETEIARLPARQREAFLLRYWEELDVAETAEVMGCSEGSVKTHCSRAVHALAQALKDQGWKT